MDKFLKREKEFQELGRISKMLIRRDLALTELREKREKELEEMQEKAITLEKSRIALMNILEDVEEARNFAEIEKNKTSAIFENFPEGLLFFNKENIISSINPKVQEFFRLKEKKTTLIGKSIKDLEEIPSLIPLIKVLGEEIKILYRKTLLLKTNLILEVSVIPVFTKERENKGKLIILRDVTREKDVERLKTEFVSIVAHQLRTPLSVIKWTLRMILDKDVGKIDEEQEELLEKTYQSNERMIKLINDLLSVARIEEEKFLGAVQKQDIVEILEKDFCLFKQIAQKNGLKFEFQKPEEKLPKIKLNSEKISLAFHNLLDNTIQYTGSGGAIKVSVKNLKEQKQILISIADTGIGVPKEQQGKIFKKFFRGENALKENTDGTGLGLFIAKNIIEAHNGKIWFESPPPSASVSETEGALSVAYSNGEDAKEGKKENPGTIFYCALPY
jgi:signal transduction histidine kinase